MKTFQRFVDAHHNDVQYGPAHPQPVPDVSVHPHSDVDHDVVLGIRFYIKGSVTLCNS